MRRTNNCYSALIVLSALCLNFMFGSEGFAQSELRETPPKRAFGSSLERFEKKGKSESNDNKQNNQKQNVMPDGETIRVNTDLIVNDVLVLNEKGNPVTGLTQSDFTIKEDAAAQKIELFSFGANAALPRSIVLIFWHVRYNRNDTQNSMGAAKSLIEKLAPQDKMAIVTCDLKLALDFTTDKDLLKKTLNNLSAQLPSSVSVSRDYGTLIAVLDEVFDDKDVRPIIIFQTLGNEVGQLKETDLLKLPEGAPTMSELRRLRNERFGKTANGRESLMESDKNHPMRGYGYSDVLDTIKKSRATIYSIIPYMRVVGHSREEQIKRGLISRERSLRARKHDESYINQNLTKNIEDAADAHIVQQSGMIQVAAASGGLTNFIEQS